MLVMIAMNSPYCIPQVLPVVCTIPVTGVSYAFRSCLRNWMGGVRHDLWDGRGFAMEEEEELALYMKRNINFQQMIRCKEVLLRKDWRIINLLRVAGLQGDGPD